MALEANSRKDLGDLHKLLLKACPAAQNAAGSIRSTLAPALGVSHQYIYDWIKAGRVPPRFVNEIVRVSAGKVTVEELIPFVIS